MGKKSRVCECGEAKVVGDEACPRCMALDGTGLPEQTLVAALRNLGGDATSEAVLVETGWSYRHLRRTAQRLEKTGRVLRIETGEERHVNQPILVLDDVKPTARGWRQQRLPRFEAYMEPVEVGSGSQRIVNVRRVAARRGRAHMQQKLKFKRRRPATETPERASA